MVTNQKGRKMPKIYLLNRNKVANGTEKAATPAGTIYFSPSGVVEARRTFPSAIQIGMSLGLILEEVSKSPDGGDNTPPDGGDSNDVDPNKDHADLHSGDADPKTDITVGDASGDVPEDKIPTKSEIINMVKADKITLALKVGLEVDESMNVGKLIAKLTDHFYPEV